LQYLLSPESDEGTQLEHHLIRTSAFDVPRDSHLNVRTESPTVSPSRLFPISGKVWPPECVLVPGVFVLAAEELQCLPHQIRKLSQQVRG
jgi:hypothetical protein